MTTPSLSSFPISIRPCTRTDLPFLATLFHASFASDPYFTILHAGCDPSALLARTLNGFEDGFEKNGARWFKAVAVAGGVEKGEEMERGKEEVIVGFSKWEYPHPDSRSGSSDEEKDPEAAILSTPSLPGSKHSFVLSFKLNFHRARSRWLSPSTDYFMAILVVHPAYQRRGIGEKLLLPGLQSADEVGTRAYVQASEAGRGLYGRLGWEGVDEIVVEYGEGVEGRTIIMIREPKRGESS
jgi:ribosomal protein S18 acetylase RimI-like enzyme